MEQDAADGEVGGDLGEGEEEFEETSDSWVDSNTGGEAAEGWGNVVVGDDGEGLLTDDA